MIFYRPILIALLLFCSFFCQAQDDKYVYQDSAMLYQDSMAAALKAQQLIKDEAVAPVDSESNVAYNYVVDTALRTNQLSIEEDSVKALKQLQSLAYAQTLDSLLHRYQQNQQKSADNGKEEISWIARFFLSPITKYFFLTLAVVFICFILYKLFFAEGFFQRSSAKINAVVPPEEDDQLSKNADYAKLIFQALENRNYRMAVRYHYLQTLQRLSFKGAIQLARDKTNYQYVSELSGKKYKSAFAALTLNYEYVWYGEFNIDENIFNTIQHQFKQFNNEV